jgi:endonuclease/exonuclease/phosphatase family metal-dependent hydrolase
MKVLTWNLFHGRAVPDRPHSLQAQFTGLLASWDWDIALLQEVPPWWPPALARAAGASERTVLTSRNFLLPLRRFVAERRPDLIRSNGGGANAILVRGLPIEEHRTRLLRRRPERRRVHAVRIPGPVWAANLHAQVRPHSLTRADIAAAVQAVEAWAGDAPVILGGDFNVPDPQLPGWTPAGSHGVDAVYARGLTPVGRPQSPDRHGLSDHAPLIVELRQGS